MWGQNVRLFVLGITLSCFTFPVQAGIRTLFKDSFSAVLKVLILGSIKAAVWQCASSLVQRYINESLLKTHILSSPKLIQLHAQIVKSAMSDRLKEQLKEVINDYASTSEAEREKQITFINTCLRLPWSVTRHANGDLDAVKRQLDQAVYGLEHAKGAILDILCAWQAGLMWHNPIICLVGPPGVGKTSFALAVARALGLPSAVVCLAGMADPDIFFRGSNRTYLGAQVGFYAQTFTRCKCINPVIIYDELDKAGGSDAHGKVHQVLTQVFDPVQNNEFTDYYLDAALDLSQMLNIVTANTLDEVPEPLIDRMHIIQIETYSPEEIAHILQHFIWKKLTKKITVPHIHTHKDQLIAQVFTDCGPTAGIRELERALQRAILRLFRTNNTEYCYKNEGINEYWDPHFEDDLKLDII